MKRPKKKGPAPDTLKVDERWKDAIKKALKKKRPPSGWPEPERAKKGE